MTTKEFMAMAGAVATGVLIGTIVYNLAAPHIMPKK
jgi:hypothetical protein